MTSPTPAQPGSRKIIFDPVPRVEGVEEVPAAISQGETMEEAKANLLDALRLVLQCQRELAEKDLSPHAIRETLQLTEA